MKVAFLTKLQVEILDDNRARLLVPFALRLDDALLIVPDGFVTDFASVPRIPFAYWLTGGKAKKAAVVHDWLYTRGAFARRWCDEAFCAIARATGVSGWRRGLMWLGIRIGGARHYGKPR